MNIRKVMTLAALAVSAAFCQAQEPQTDEAAAMILGQSLRQAFDSMVKKGVDLDREKVLCGVVNVFFGDTEVNGVNAEEADRIMRHAMGLDVKLPDAVAPADESAENEWVASQASLPRAELLEGGVVLQRLVEGSGASPKVDDTVSVMYIGRLSNGAVFDATDTPIDLPLQHIVKGLAQALQAMHEGGTYRVFIPPMLGYGSEAVMDLIPAYSALDFTISDLKIK